MQFSFDPFYRNSPLKLVRECISFLNDKNLEISSYLYFHHNHVDHLLIGTNNGALFLASLRYVFF